VFDQRINTDPLLGNLADQLVFTAQKRERFCSETPRTGESTLEGSR
jgi:hypothetical protein